jgi:hypothetical protein
MKLKTLCILCKHQGRWCSNPKTDEILNVVRLQLDDAMHIHEQFIQHLKQRTDSPRHFPDLPSLQAWFDANAFKTFDCRVRHGAWVRMSDYEVALAQRKLPPPPSNP